MTNGEHYKTCEERIDAHDAYCASRVGACGGECDRCAFAWLAMEYKPKPMPCPFCGSKEIITVKSDWFDKEYYFPRCGSCGTEMGVSSESEDEAFEVWNRRVK